MRFLSKLRRWPFSVAEWCIAPFHSPIFAGIMKVQKGCGGWDLSTQSSDLKARNIFGDELARGFYNICVSLYDCIGWSELRWYSQLKFYNRWQTLIVHKRSQKHVQHTFSSLHHLVIAVHPWDPLGCWALEAVASTRTMFGTLEITCTWWFLIHPDMVLAKGWCLRNVHSRFRRSAREFIEWGRCHIFKTQLSIVWNEQCHYNDNNMLSTCWCKVHRLKRGRKDCSWEGWWDDSGPTKYL